MKPSTIDMLRAYLLAASLAAALMEIIVVAALLAFGASARTFQTAPFRLGMAFVILCAVLVIKRIARAAFRSAVTNHYARFSDPRSSSVVVSAACPKRQLVILHLRFQRLLFDCQQAPARAD